MDYFKRTKVRSIILDDSVKVGERPIILGWVRTIRVSKNVAFVEVNDGSCMGNIQGVISNPESFPDLQKINTGASVRMVGELIESQGEGQKYEITLDQLDLIGEADQTYPLQKKRHSFEYLREIAHLRARGNTFGAVNRIRSKIAYAVHKFYQERGFYYVHTPIISASDCEGAGEMFRVTTLDFDDPPRVDGKVDFREDFFSSEAFLTVSGQLEGELIATALGDIYTFGPTFRAENSNTARHASEFWMIEPEMAFCELDEDMQVAEDFLKYLFEYALTECADEMNFFGNWIDKTVRETLQSVIKSEFVRVSYTEAVKILEKADQKFEFPVAWGTDLQSEHERYLTEKHFKRPAIVYDYPREIKAFYMRVNDDGKTVRAMDVLVPKIGEIIGGSEREYRHDILMNRIVECGLPVENYDWYLDIRKYGTVPHSGFGLGFDRTLMYITGMANIRDVVPFPRVPRWARF
ncbi:MAG: asparagine--tRNA ligase [candidate division Zixibacteria bacterium]|nr:asparagine--tRNA ligase [candidate division Zixibacteria bacterium]MBU1471154.1 asparagine--tRNA ligase [candidate division Zixibacteria bacterium]MBU2625856.1 asparagine--tRNA ligase [candidate division Zixibacteria bacterium]